MLRELFFVGIKKTIDEVINNEIYKLNKPEDVISINITPYINPDKADGYYFPICFLSFLCLSLGN